MSKCFENNGQGNFRSLVHWDKRPAGVDFDGVIAVQSQQDLNSEDVAAKLAYNGLRVCKTSMDGIDVLVNYLGSLENALRAIGSDQALATPGNFREVPPDEAMRFAGFN